MIRRIMTAELELRKVCRKGAAIQFSFPRDRWFESTSLRTVPLQPAGREHIGSSEPLPELDVIAVGVADLRPGIGLANPWTPDDVNTLGRQLVGRPLHVVDFESDHAVSEMFSLRGRVDRDAFV